LFVYNNTPNVGYVTMQKPSIIMQNPSNGAFDIGISVIDGNCIMKM